MTAKMLCVLCWLAFLQGQQEFRLEVRPEQQTQPPQATIIGPSSIRGIATDGRKPTPELNMIIRSLAADQAHTSISYELDLQNATSHKIEIPIGLDGKAAFDSCPGKLIQDAFLSLAVPSSTTTHTPLIADMYGCDGLKQSMVTLNPGDWLTIAGTHRLPKGTVSPASVRLDFGMGTRQYSSQDGKVRVDSTITLSTGAEHSVD
jgi:hypothetical protein